MKVYYSFLFVSLLFTSKVSVAQFPYTETFKTSAAPGIVFGGTSNPALLTAGQIIKYPSTTGYVTDATSGGYLRLTNNDKNQAGFVYNNTLFPTDNGLRISFEYFIYGGNIGVGIGFFLFDGSIPFNIGAWNSSLGYAQNNLNGVIAPGLSGGYLGLGLDTYGVFGRSNEGKQGGYTTTKGSSVSLRGAGNGSALVASNYPFLTGVQTTSWNSASNSNPNFNIVGGGTSRAPICSDSRYRKIFIELKPKNVSGGKSYDITVKMTVGGATPLTYTLIDNYTGLTTVTPANLKYGFSASSGNETNFHEIRNLTIDSYYTESGQATAFDYTPTCTDTAPGPVVTTPVTPNPVGNLTKIPIDGNRWFQLNNTSKGLNALFDSVTNIAVSTGPGWVLPSYDAYYPVKDGEEISITDVRFYDWQGTSSDSLTLSVITEQGQRVPVAYFTGSKYLQWVGPYLDRVTTEANKFKLDIARNKIKYLVLTVKSIFPTEMELYGTYKAPPAVSLATKKSVKLKEMLGVNAFEWDFLGGGSVSPTQLNPAKIKAMKSFAGIRHYMDWEKLELTEGKYTFSPVHSGGWDYDAMYTYCKLEGIEVLACLKTLPTWMVNTYPSNERDYENTPLRYGKNFSDPLSYIEQAKVAFQYAARYGSNASVDLGLLSVNTAIRWTGDKRNEVKRGLDLVKYIECDNERNKWWKGRKAYQTAFEYAANMSAFYDGHKNTMGEGVGVKNADPSMIVVMGGLASQSTEYVRGMIDWCKNNRGYNADGSINVCWDVINYHEYANDAESAQGQTSTRGAAPEKTQIAKFANDFNQMSHELAGDMEVWITEAGFDLNQGSVLKAISVGNRSALLTQADWTLRSALHYARQGIKRVFFYKTYDVDSLSRNKFSSMGLLNKNNSRRPVAEFMYQTNRLLGEYSYKETLQNDPVVDRYEFNGKSAYALVVPDEVGRTASYSLNLGMADSAKIYTPSPGSDSMSVVKVATVDGKVQLTITETPIFVIGFADGTNNPAARVSGELLLQSQVEVNAAQSQISLEVFPNPVTNFIDVQASGKTSELLEVKIYDNQGRLFKSVISIARQDRFNQRISMSDAPFGIYVVRMKHGNAILTKKIMRTL